MAACRTVLPFSTVMVCPSIVSVTEDSMTTRSYQLEVCRRAAGSLFDERGEREIIAADLGRSKGAGQRNAQVHRSVGDRDEDIGGRPVRVLQRYRHRHVEEIARLLEVEHDGVAIDAVPEGQPRQCRSVDPSVEEPRKRSARLLFHRFAELGGVYAAKPRGAI